MSKMLLRIKLFFHAFKRLVYPNFNSHLIDTQEENDQAFPVAR